MHTHGRSGWSETAAASRLLMLPAEAWVAG